jgi:hypothetical protein
VFAPAIVVGFESEVELAPEGSEPEIAGHEPDVPRMKVIFSWSSNSNLNLHLNSISIFVFPFPFPALLLPLGQRQMRKGTEFVETILWG